ncbi:uncharacterized protein LOC135703607 [Ochlerotatus camptorhynchus]|uniref:uncharacterized protein LOC135703607 n=1 Tax=Ochlerotatus camptorhynchus TaxID=644619 RepID=UPI0031D6E85D
MSKRCCAASCYNSVATNRSVEYFGFPKSTDFASAWAKAAGREDLLEKSINNIIKYFLCSEHFSDDCFQDPPHNRKLKKTSRPVVVPIPTIFHNNFNECVSKSLKEERRVITQDDAVSLIQYQEQSSDEIDSENSIIVERLNECDDIQMPAGLMEPLLLTTVDDLIITSEHQYSDTEITEVVQYDDVKEDEDKEEQIVTIIDSATPQHVQRQDDGDVESTYSEIIIGLSSCRLCLSAKENELLIPIFDDGSEVAYILESILPGAVKKDDGFPQQVCLVCLESATRCLNTIEKFKTIQDKLKMLQ